MDKGFPPTHSVDVPEGGTATCSYLSPSCLPYCPAARSLCGIPPACSCSPACLPACPAPPSPPSTLTSPPAFLAPSPLTSARSVRSVRASPPCCLQELASLLSLCDRGPCSPPLRMQPSPLDPLFHCPAVPAARDAGAGGGGPQDGSRARARVQAGLGDEEEREPKRGRMPEAPGGAPPLSPGPGTDQALAPGDLQATRPAIGAAPSAPAPPGAAPVGDAVATAGTGAGASGGGLAATAAAAAAALPHRKLRAALFPPDQTSVEVVVEAMREAGLPLSGVVRARGRARMHVRVMSAHLRKCSGPDGAGF